MPLGLWALDIDRDVLHSLEFISAEGEDDSWHDGDHAGDDCEQHREHVVDLVSVDVGLKSEGFACNDL